MEEFKPLVECGVLGVVAYLFYKEMIKKDTQNREDTAREVSRLEKQIIDNKIEAKEDKNVFIKAIDSFNSSLKEFKSINTKIDNLEVKVDKIIEDIK